MKLPLKWLKEYISYDIEHEEFVEKMMWRGFEVADIMPELNDVQGVVVGKIVSLQKHPQADKLNVCEVDTGDGELKTIVCGAPNAYAGMVAPVALPGAKLPGGIEIEPTQMRGVVSSGMLCSGKELGLTEADYKGSEVNGLLDLPEDLSLGMPIAKALDMDDVIFDIEITPNRPDCQSIIGMAREAAAALDKPFNEPQIKPVQFEGDATEYAKVTVNNPALCPRYAARVVTDINIAQSPAWMKKKLRSVGLRPINNIVDITNLVMIEYGHPMHAFDLSCVAQKHIIVRNAYENETVRTLDGKQRPVDPEMLLITDPVKGVGIAGVMGGENSEITDKTEAALFEAAVFVGSNIRATARKLRHMTDAAARFIKGVDPINAKKALDRAMELVEQLGAGRIVGDTIDACTARLEDRQITVCTEHINRILNTAITPDEMVKMLGSINIPAKANGTKLDISVPHYRNDIESGIEADWDIAEEIARIYGYYNIKPTLMQGDTFRGRLTRPFLLEDTIKDCLSYQGGLEMYNYNFTGPKVLDALLLAEDDEKRRAVKLLNPFGEDQSLMRTTLIPGMLKVCALNINRKTGAGRFFEIGNTHLDYNFTLPEERRIVGLIYFGDDESFYTLKGTIEELLAVLGIDELSFKRGGGSYLHPGRSAQVFSGNNLLGELGEVHPDVASYFGVSERAYVAELSFDVLNSLHTFERKYKPLPRFPVVERDIAVIADETVEADTLKAVIEKAPANVLISDVKLFDVFRGGDIKKGQKSMAYSYTLRLEDKTLTEEDIIGATNEIIKALQDCGARLRG